MGTLASIAGDLLWKRQHWSHQVWTTAGETVAPNHFVNVHVNAGEPKGKPQLLPLNNTALVPSLVTEPVLGTFCSLGPNRHQISWN